MSPPTQSDVLRGFDDAFPKLLIHNDLFQNRNLIGGLMSPPYSLSRFQRDKRKFVYPHYNKKAALLQGRPCFRSP